MKVLGIIPARGGSKGVIRKNLKLLGGKPLIVHTIQEALNSKIDKLVVSTEDSEIFNLSKRFGPITDFKRPKFLAQDSSNSIDVAIHALKKVENINNCIYDAVIYLQPTTPFRTSDDINNCIELLKNNETSDSVISVVDVGAYHPARMKYIKNGSLIDPPFCEKYENQNRQELKSMFIRNGAIYLTKREILLKKTFKGFNSLAYKMPSDRSINIDTHEDFEYAEFIYFKKNEKFN